tara:strand:- start:124 stop:426 length:303 start_codon:yes stop_codon:yes gene_type:complete
MFVKLKKNYFLLLVTFLFLYFFFNFLDGERGLFSYFKKKQLLKNLQNEEFKLTNKIKDIEFKNSLLTNNLDLDYIEILLREKFLLGKKGEKFYIIKKDEN